LYYKAQFFSTSIFVIIGIVPILATKKMLLVIRSIFYYFL